MLSFDELPKLYMVYNVAFEEGIPNRHTIYCSIPCREKETYNEGDVMSVRWNGLYKGIKGKYFPNTMNIDFWLDGERRYTRVNRTGTVQICAVTSTELLDKIIKKLSEILTNADNYANSVAGNKEFKRATKWLLENTVGNEFECVTTFKLKRNPNLGNMEFCKYVTENKIAWPSTAPAKYKSIITKFKKVSTDILYNNNACHNSLVSRVDTLYNSEISTNSYTVSEIKLCNAVYRFPLGYVLNRYAFAECLLDLGYDVNYPSTSSSEVIVYVKIEDVKCTFFFYPKGSVTLNSGSIECARKAYDMLITDVYSIRNKCELVV